MANPTDDDLDLLDDTDNETDPSDDLTDPSRLVNKLRRQLRQRDKELKDSRDRLTVLERKEALREANLNLNEKQMKALLAAHEDGELTPQALRATAVSLGWAEPEENPVEQDLETVDRIERATNGATPSSSKAGEITTADVAEWSTEKTMRFRQKFPDEFEALKRGEAVRVPSFA